MQIDAHPGDVYAFPVPRCPTRRKVGKAVSSARRMSAHQTSNDEKLNDVICVSFLNCVNAERHIKDRLAEMGRHHRGEFYDVSADEFLRIALEYKKLELAQAQALAAAAQFLHLSDYFEGALAYPGGVSPVAKHLLEHPVRRANMATTVGALIQGALCSPAPRELERRLERVGVLSSQACQCALLDKREGGELERFFEKTPAALTWRRQLAAYAGFDAELKPVYADDFKRSKMATSHFIEISCRE